MTTKNESTMDESSNANIIIPLESITTVLSFLPCNEMLRCCNVCKRWKEAISNIQAIHLDLRQADNSDQRLKAATASFSNLRYIEILIRNDREVDPCLLRNFLSRHAKIRYFRMCGDYIDSDVALKPLEDASDVVHLEFEYTRFCYMDSLVQLLQDKAHLKVLRLRNVQFIANHGYPDLHLSDVRFFCSFSCPGSGDCQILSRCIGKLNKVEELILDGCAIRYFDAESMFSGMANLRSLEICNPTEETMVAIARYCPCLQRLKISDCSEISLAGVIRVLRSCPVSDLTLKNGIRRNRWYDCKRELYQASETLANVVVVGAVVGY
mmetsp:Transcript_26092/g.38891  ORF Transcript_26092/g.38891 Transcript_26092/m.38891 type:complete len:324 (-) Transcript_26092:303-1274(-)|eukprot:CAMPEP_0116017650 /NCGR_PEP_ID=MMETSP0321-20121206/8174_1 /TAXON_ID=163516 /ORGANISM="Leptocylindrus danicus var. danicus, Strain B650" /LENGTH=323 /DNA_ID=CAMNT_0003487883 /DNA_START=1344 /DNA_END=2315 /DNA_ORIENTATION=-